MQGKSKVIAKKIITLKGIKIEVRLLEVPICVHWDSDHSKCKFKGRILVRSRYVPSIPLNRQELIKEKLRKHDYKGVLQNEKTNE